MEQDMKNDFIVIYLTLVILVIPLEINLIYLICHM